MKAVLKKWLVLGLALLAVAVAMARVHVEPPVSDASIDPSLPPTIAANSLRDLFPH
jgi:hypothetical protein